MTVSAAEHLVLGASLGTGRRDLAFREMLQLLLPRDAVGLQHMFCSTDLPSGVITLSKKKGKSGVNWGGDQYAAFCSCAKNRGMILDVFLGKASEM